VSSTPPLDRTRGAARAEPQRRLLRRVADALAWSLEPAEVAAQLIDAACTALDAPQGWCAIREEGGNAVLMLASRGYDADTTAAWRRVPIDADVPMTLAVRTGRPIVHASAADRLRDYPALVGGGATRYVEASAVMPMVFEGRTTGALAVTFDRVMEIDAGDRWFLEALAAQGAGAMERARLFEAVRQRDERLKLGLEASGTWIWEWDIAANTVRWTPEPPDFGRPMGNDASSSAWVRMVRPEDRRRLKDALRACLQRGSSNEVEFRVGNADEPERWLSAFGRLLRNEAGDPTTVIGTARDITERKMAELEHDRRLEAERDAARLRDAFIGVVSHELRTPITTIFGGTRVLSRRWREMEPAARDALLADVSGEADRLFRMVEDLLVITRVERGRLDVGDEPVALRAVIERVLASERARSPDVEFACVIPTDLPSVEGEEMYVEQVLRNLLANAAKYGGAGSLVTVEAEADDDAVMLRVLDQGPGIAESEAERLFELFYRSPATAPRVAGAGIGLFVCRQLAMAMGGSIGAANRPDGGAAFELVLRRYADDEA
jgi:PAS domain S-box-containing protein